MHKEQRQTRLLLAQACAALGLIAEAEHHYRYVERLTPNEKGDLLSPVESHSYHSCFRDQQARQDHSGGGLLNADSMYPAWSNKMLH